MRLEGSDGSRGLGEEENSGSFRQWLMPQGAWAKPWKTVATMRRQARDEGGSHHARA